VGVYIVEIIFILTILVNGVENGSDKLAERYNLGRNLLRGTTLYTIISLAVMVTFNFIAASILVSIVS
jgi:phage shock protein PspC (stress-responsive transcriptional regulator)